CLAAEGDLAPDAAYLLPVRRGPWLVVHVLVQIPHRRCALEAEKELRQFARGVHMRACHVLLARYRLHGAIELQCPQAERLDTGHAYRTRPRAPGMAVAARILGHEQFLPARNIN